MIISELYEIKAFNARTTLFPPGILAPLHPHSLEIEHSTEQVKAKMTVGQHTAYYPCLQNPELEFSPFTTS